jgi:transglutaminase-like putative cysteine protease
MTNGSDERMAVTAAGASLVAALTLVPLIKGPTWFFAAAVMVLTVMVAGLVGRQLARGWWPAVVGLQAVLLFLAIVVLFARSELVNPPGAVRMLIDLVQTGLDVTQSQSPPVESARGIVLLAAGGAGLVALAVDILATSFRQPALAGLPLLAMYCVPAALLDNGLPWYLFLVSAAGFLLLLSADAGDRVRAWGRVLASAGQRSAVRPGGDTGLARGGRRVAVAAVAVAVVVPALVPGLNNQLLGGSGNGDDGSGGSVITRINPILDMRRDLNDPVDTELLTYTTSVPDPDPLRIVTDDEYDGKTWKPSNKKIPRSQTIQSGMPPVPGLTGAVNTTKQTSQIQIYRMRQTYLPLPYPTTKVTGLNGEWLFDSETLNVIGNGTTTLDAQYSTEFLQITPTAEQLANASAAPTDIVKKYTALPKGMPDKIAQVAKDVAGTGSHYQQAVRLQDFFRNTGGFRYTTQAPENSNGDGSYQAILDFLTAKSGYCVHFASTMAVMARELGIPARVAVGFLPGSLQTENKRIISSKDAHAWPELYFGGVGWVRFEPTPRSNDGVPEWTLPQSSTGDDSSSNDTTTTTTTPDTSEGSASSSAEANVPDEQAAAAAGQSSGGFSVPWQPLVLLLVVLLALASPRLAASVATRRRWRRATTVPGLAAAAWDDLRLGLSDLGVRWAASWTPRAVRQRLNDDYQLNPEQSAALDRLVEELEDAFYAPPSDALGRSAAERRRDVALVVGAVAVQKSSQTRWRARLWPASGLTALTGLGAWITAKFQRDRSSDDSEDGGKPREKTGSGVL